MARKCRDKKLSPSGRVAHCAERGFRLVELSLKVFPLCGENISFGLNWEKVARMRRKRGARRLKISDKISGNQNTNLLILFNPLLFQVVVDPSLSPFIPTITIAFGGRHLSRMQPFSLIPNLYRARTFFIFDLMTPPKGKAKTSSVGRADTFPEREGIDLFRRQSRHLPRKGRLFAERDQYYFRENCRDFYTV